MLHADCPHCGAAAALVLAHPDRFHCAHCRTTSATPPALRAALEASAAVVLKHTAKLRRLTTVQREARRRSGPLRHVVPLLCATVGLTTVAFLLMWPLRGSFGSPNEQLMVVAAPALMILPFVAAIVLLFRNHRRVQEVCTASPPPVHGAPARCGLCGADLRPATAAVADCTYCGTDNVVRSDGLHVARVESRWAAERIEAEVTRRARIAAGGLGRGVGSMLLFVPVAPFLSVAGVHALEELRSWRPAEIVLVERSGATCVARVHPLLFWNGALPSHGSESPTEARTALMNVRSTYVDEDAARPPTSLLGLRAWTTDGRVGDIRSVTEPDEEGAPILIRIDTPSGSFRQPAEQTCLHAGPLPVAIADLGRRPAAESVRIVTSSGRVVMAVPGLIALASQGRTTYLRLPPGRPRSVAVASEHVFVALDRRLVRFPVSALQAGGPSATTAPAAPAQLLTSDMVGGGAAFGSWFHWVQHGRSTTEGVYRANGTVTEHVVKNGNVSAVGAGPRHIYYADGRGIFSVVPGSAAPAEVVYRFGWQDAESPIIDEGPSLLLTNGRDFFRIRRSTGHVEQLTTHYDEDATFVGISSLRRQQENVYEHRIPGLVLERAGTPPRVVVPGAWLASYTVDGTTLHFAAAEPADGRGGWFNQNDRRSPKAIVHHRVFSLAIP